MTDFEPKDRPGTEARHGDDAVDREVYRDNIRADFERLAVVFDDAGDVPATASGRVNAGRFDDPISLAEYLDNGGLLSYDEDGNPVPVGWVYIVEYYDADYDTYEYEVYIDTDTNP